MSMENETRSAWRPLRGGGNRPTDLAICCECDKQTLTQIYDPNGNALTVGELVTIINDQAEERHRLRDAVVYLRGHVTQNGGVGCQRYAYVWQSVWTEFERRVTE